MVNDIVKHYGVFVIRTPLFLPDDVLHLRAELREKKPNYEVLLKNPIFNESLWLANQKLYSLIQSRQLEKYPDAIIALEKYLLRMSQRSTPFGLSAGICAGYMGEQASVKPLDMTQARRYVRIDSACLTDIKDYMLCQPEIRPHLKWCWNSARCTLGHSELFVAGRDELNPYRHSHCFMPDSSIIKRLRLATDKVFTVKYLKSIICEVLDESESAAEQLITYIIQQGVIIPETYQLSNSNNTPKKLVKEYSKVLQKNNTFINMLNKTTQHLEITNQTLLYSALEHYQQIQNLLNGFVQDESINNPVYVNLITPKPTVTPSIKQCNRILNDINIVLNISNTPCDLLTHFMDQFVSKYGNQEVPLLLAIDKDLGIGYGYTCYGKEDLLQDANFIYETNDRNNVVLDKINQYVIHNILHQKDEIAELQLPDDIFEPRKKLTFPIGDTLGAMGTILNLGRDTNDLSFWIRQLKGPSAISWLGRFCEADDEIYKIARIIAEDEQFRLRNEGIVADIIFGSYQRDANVTKHSQIRDYEIEYFLNSDLQDINTIKLSDLVVSVNENQVILRSTTLDKRIFPRISSAHNTQRLHHPHLYQFFGDLFKQTKNYILPNFEPALKIIKKLPRIRYSSLILQPAMWLIDESDISLIKNISEKQSISQAISLLQEKKGLPTEISMGIGDQLLDLNLKDQLHIKIIYDFITKDNINIIKESFTENIYGSDHKINRHELFIPFYLDSTYQPNDNFSFIRLPEKLLVKLNQEDSTNNYDLNQPISASSSIRLSEHSDQWVFISLWCGRGLINNIIVNHILPLTKSSLNEGKISKWFYIRYDDPKPHIRLRLQGSKRYIHDQFYSRLKKVSDYFSGLVTLSMHSYEPEYARYGGLQGMMFAEDIFFHDSVSSSEFLHKNNLSDNDENMTELCLSSVDTLLESLNININQKYILMNDICKKYYTEFGVSKDKKRSLDDNYRSILNRSSVLSKLSTIGSSEASDPFIRSRNNCISSLFSSADRDRKQWLSSFDIKLFIPAYIHLSLNRLFSNNRRLKEMMICDLLRRSYESYIARTHNKKHRKAAS